MKGKRTCQSPGSVFSLLLYLFLHSTLGGENSRGSSREEKRKLRGRSARARDIPAKQRYRLTESWTRVRDDQIFEFNSGSLQPARTGLTFALPNSQRRWLEGDSIKLRLLCQYFIVKTRHCFFVLTSSSASPSSSSSSSASCLSFPRWRVEGDRRVDGGGWFLSCKSTKGVGVLLLGRIADSPSSLPPPSLLRHLHPSLTWRVEGWGEGRREGVE